MAATQGGTQSLHTNSLDEALALPSDFSARIARNTQLFLQHEAGTSRVIDPWGGSYFVERLTADLTARAGGSSREIEAMGGMANAIAAGIPKLRIEEAAARTQARIDTGEQAIIGVNTYPSRRGAGDRASQGRQRRRRARQLEKLARLKAERDPQAVSKLSPSSPRSPAPARAIFWTLPSRRPAPGRRSARCRWRLEHACGAPCPGIRAISGVYAEAAHGADAFEKARGAGVFRNDGKPPRILVAKIGQDGHDRGQKVIASAFGDLGFAVTSANCSRPRRRPPPCGRDDVHVVGFPRSPPAI